MVLHLRKITAVIIALALMVSASPAFAEEMESEVLEEEIQVEESIPEEEPVVVTEAAETSEPVHVTEKHQSAFAYLTLIDEEGTKVIDREKIELKDGITARDFVEKALKDRNLSYSWEDFAFEYNSREIKDDSFEKQTLDSNDVLVAIVNVELNETPQELESENKSEILATKDEIDSAHSGAVSKATDIMNSNGWKYGNEWGVIGVSRFTDISLVGSDSYCVSLATELDNNKSAKLSSSKSSDNARTVLALTALGYDPTDVNGYNLLEPLADFDYASKPYLTGPIWTLIAIDSHGYNLPEAGKGKTQTTKELLVKTILEARVGDGWAFSGTTPDVDMTCMAIQALAPYREDAKVSAAIDSAVEWLYKQQRDNGSFKSYGNETSESASQVITALTSVGIDPNTDSRFIKNGNSVVDSLISFKAKDGGFLHLVTDSKYNTLATYQGCYALTAYYRFITGKSSLYNMSEVVLKKFTAKPDPKKKDEPADDPGKDIKLVKEEQAAKTLAAQGRTFSLGGRTIKVDASEDAEDLAAAGNEKNSEMRYNSAEEKRALMKVLPWIYGGIGALAALALVLILRNRKPE